MSKQRFVGDFDFAKKEILITDKEIINQAKNVLRLSIGDELVLVSAGREALSEIIFLTKDELRLALGEVKNIFTEPTNKVTLFCSILKKENFEWVVQKATEIGVNVVVPVLTKRTVKTGLNFERLNKIAREATEQSGRGTVPEIRPAIGFADAIKMRKDFGQALILEQTSTGEPEIDQVGSVAILIGPEGGWEEDEITMALGGGWVAWSLGQTTLRAETAAIVAVAKAVRFK